MRRLISISGRGTSNAARSRQPLQLPPAHRALLADARGNLGEHVEFAVLGQQLDHRAPGGLPARAWRGACFSRRDRPFGVPHKILHRRIAGAHFRQHRFSEDAATHHPDAPGTAVLLDPGEEHAQRRAVRRVAGQHLRRPGAGRRTRRVRRRSRWHRAAICFRFLPLPPRQPKPKTVQTLANPDRPYSVGAKAAFSPPWPRRGSWYQSRLNVG